MRKILVLIISVTVIFYTFQSIFNVNEKDWYDLAQTALAKKNTEEATKWFSALLRVNPKDCSARLGLAEAYIQTGNIEAGKKQLESVLACSQEILAISAERLQKIRAEQK